MEHMPCHHCGKEHPVGGYNPCHDPISITEIIDVLRNGGLQVCDHAISMWESGKYGNSGRSQYIGHWHKMRGLVTEICSDMKREAKLALKAK